MEQKPNPNQLPNPNANPQNFSNFGDFSKKEEEWKSPQGMDEVSKGIADLVSSVRILEDRYLNLRKKSQLTDQNLIELQKEFFAEKKHLNQELVEAKMKLQELTEDLNLMRGELKDVVKQKDLKVLSTYLDLWEPIQFVTRKEVDNLLNEKQKNSK